MKTIKNDFKTRLLIIAIAIAMLWTVPPAGAQSSPSAVIDAGSTVYVRTIQEINTNDTDGRVFPGVVDKDVMGRRGQVLIPKGSDVELVVRRTSNNELALDMDSVMVRGQRYGVEAEETVIPSEQKEGIGKNKRTAEHVGGGAVLGAIIGAVAGGGKGAAIGAVGGAAAGAGVQVLTKGKTVRVPAETLLTFRLTEPLRAGITDSGYTNNGYHYHHMNSQESYSSELQKPGAYDPGNASISIGPDENISWRGPERSTIYVQVDNQAPRFFAAGPSGNQEAGWMSEGHVYTFIMKDTDGNELARSRLDLRNRR